VSQVRTLDATLAAAEKNEARARRLLTASALVFRAIKRITSSDVGQDHSRETPTRRLSYRGLVKSERAGLIVPCPLDEMLP
jgi:hypothetical protein